MSKTDQCTTPHAVKTYMSLSTFNKITIPNMKADCCFPIQLSLSNLFYIYSVKTTLHLYLTRTIFSLHHISWQSSPECLTKMYALWVNKNVINCSSHHQCKRQLQPNKGKVETESHSQHCHIYINNSYKAISPATNPKVQDGGLVMPWEYKCSLYTMHTVHIK